MPYDVLHWLPIFAFTNIRTPRQIILKNCLVLYQYVIAFCETSMNKK